MRAVSKRVFATAQQHARPALPPAMVKARPSLTSLAQPPQAGTMRLQQLPHLSELHTALSEHCEWAAAFADAHPQVANLGRLKRRLARELASCQQLLTDQLQAGSVPEGRLQGYVNNLRGFHGEVLALHEAQDVVAVYARFALATAEQQQQQQHGSGASSSSSRSGARKTVEVDVVAHGGLTWIEVKNQEAFGTQSVHWRGASHAKGLAQQAADLVAAAAAPANARRWRSPRVVLFFPSGVSGDVADALRQLGAVVADGPGSLAALPAPEQPRRPVNLDTTSLCALVSDVSWGDPHRSELQDWARKNSHWQECLAAQQARPVMDELQPILDAATQLIASCAALQQFDSLMACFSGPREQQRWQQLRERLAVWHVVDNGGGGGGGEQQAAGCSCGLLRDGRAQQADQQWCELPGRLRGAKMTRQQLAVFGAGEAAQALTLTANGGVVRSAAQAGVHLEASLHRPVWLAGL